MTTTDYKVYVNIQTGNEIIAKFMDMKKTDGFTTSMSGLQVSATGYEHNGEFMLLEDLQFHSSYDWLMPVIDRIEELGAYSIAGRKVYSSVKFDRHSVEIYFSPKQKYLLHLKFQPYHVDKGTWMHPMFTDHIVKQFDFSTHGKRMGLYTAILEFINWYNNSYLIKTSI